MLRLFRKKEPPSDEDLVKSYQSTADMEVLGKLYGRYMDLVFGVCLKYLRDVGKAEDAVMGIFEELVIKVKKYEIQKFKPWLHVFTKNYCLMQIRKEKKASLTVFYDSELMQFTDWSHPIDESNEIQEERHQALDYCIKNLPQKQKECVQLFYLEGKTYKEIAEIRGEQLSKVRSFIQNGRRNLKICIEKKKTGE